MKNKPCKHCGTPWYHGHQKDEDGLIECRKELELQLAQEEGQRILRGTMLRAATKPLKRLLAYMADEGDQPEYEYELTRLIESIETETRSDELPGMKCGA